MTLDEVIDLFNEAGDLAEWKPGVGNLMRFAELVAKHEREECAKVCEQHAKDSWDHEGGALACADKIRARGEQ